MEPLVSTPEPPAREPMLFIMDEATGVPDTVWQDAKAFCARTATTVTLEEMARQYGIPRSVFSGALGDEDKEPSHAVVIDAAQLDEWLVMVPHDLIEGLPPGTISSHDGRGRGLYSNFDLSAAYNHFLRVQEMQLQVIPYLTGINRWAREQQVDRLRYQRLFESPEVAYTPPPVIVPQGILQAPDSHEGSVKDAENRVKALQKEVEEMERRKHQPRADAPRSVPYKRRDRVSRNSPCPCGSGKKYKACCLPFQTR